VAAAAAGAGRRARANRHAIPYPLPILCNQGKSRANQGKLSQIKAKKLFFSFHDKKWPVRRTGTPAFGIRVGPAQSAIPKNAC